MADGDGRSSPAAKPNFKPTSTRCVNRLETSVRDSAYASSERRRPALAGVWESLDKGAPPPRAPRAPRNETPVPPPSQARAARARRAPRRR